MVSCVLPTKNRASFIPQAIRSYQSQTYPDRELVIVDQGSDHTAKLIPPDPTIRYYRADRTLNTGDMRNECAKHARGEIICHFDSDDWSAPERVTDQVTRLGKFGVLTGYRTMLFYDMRDGKCYKWFSAPPMHITYALGTSLCYQREWWVKHPFPSMKIGEDIRFYKESLRLAARYVVTADANGLMVARVHDAQTCYKALNKLCYQPMPPTVLPEAFLCALTSSVT